MRKLRLAQEAKKDLKSIRKYISIDSIYYAEKTINEIYKISKRLLISPNLGRIVPEYDNKEVKEIIYKSYRIIYTFNSNTIYIRRVLHQSRQFNLKVNSIFQ